MMRVTEFRRNPKKGKLRIRGNQDTLLTWIQE
jgi:hypothetical protein